MFRLLHQFLQNQDFSFQEQRLLCLGQNVVYQKDKTLAVLVKIVKVQDRSSTSTQLQLEKPLRYIFF